MQVSDSYDLHNRTWKCLARSNLTRWATKFGRIAYSLLQKAAIPPFFLYCLPTTFVPVSTRPISFSNTGTRSNLQSLLRELVPARCFSGFLSTAGDVPGRLHLLNRFSKNTMCGFGLLSCVLLLWSSKGFVVCKDTLPQSSLVVVGSVEAYILLSCGT